MPPQTLSLDQVVALGHSADPIAFIGVAQSAFAQGADRDDLRLVLIQRLVEQGLLRRAQHCAEGLSDEIRSHPEFDEMRAKLSARRNNGLIPTDSLEPTFQANLLALSRRYDWVDAVAAAWAAERDHIEFHITAKGLRQVFSTRAGPLGGWRPAFGDHRPSPPVNEMKAQFQGKILPPIIILGVGLGAPLPWMHEASARTFLDASALIYQIEPSYLALAAALHLCDWREPIGDERVRLCCGPDAFDQLERQVRGDAWNLPPGITVRTSPWDAEALRAGQPRLATLQADVESAWRTLREEVGAPYRGRDSAWWHRRYAEALREGGPPLRVLGITSRFTTVLQYSVRDAMAAFEQLGCQTRTLIEPDVASILTPGCKLAMIRDFQPDLIFLIDHIRQGQAIGLIDGVPVVTWIQDRLEWLFCKETGEGIGPLDFCLGFNRQELIEQYGYPAERFLACEMASNRDALTAEPDPGDLPDNPGEIDERFRCDLAFASNLSNRAGEYRERCARDDPTLLPLLDAMQDALAAMADRGGLNGALEVHAFVSRMQEAVGIELPDALRAAVLREFVRPAVDRLIRLQTLDWAADWAEATGRRLHLYGNGWDAHPKFARYGRGYLEHGPELGRAFRAAKINLHAGVNHAFHQRVLDGLAAGGFFLIRRHAGDVWHRFHQTLREIIEARGLREGATIHCDDLPPRLRAAWSEDRQLRGLPVDEPYGVGAAGLYSGDDPASLGADHSPMAIWPDFWDVTFDSSEEMAERLEWFLQREDERHDLAMAMREQSRRHFSYKSLMSRLLRWMTTTLGHADKP